MHNGKVLFDRHIDEDFNKFINETYKNSSLLYPKFSKIDNLTKLGFLTSDILIRKDNPTRLTKNDDIGIILTNASASLENKINFNNKIKENIDNPKCSSSFIYTFPNSLIGEICIKHRITGENGFFIFEKFNEEFLFNYVSNLFELKKVNHCISGWVDFIDNNYYSILYMIKNAKVKDIASDSIMFNSNNLKILYFS